MLSFLLKIIFNNLKNILFTSKRKPQSSSNHLKCLIISRQVNSFKVLQNRKQESPFCPVEDESNFHPGEKSEEEGHRIAQAG